ncbi:ATP-grasp domain-containing protein [Streptomyces sp. NBC_01240]|uniref:ATP-grasp domain-containing protein n=1 Tax=Streptomyces sp. NBC_01240 TaxID=2903793 RepID=UPI002E1251D9|nr:hypothetical protein OG466_14485 [Streptomyces sp. NBC_01240]
MTGRARVLVLGHEKKLARRAMDRFTTRYEFVRPDAVDATTATTPGPQLLQAVDRLVSEAPLAAVVATTESAMLAAGFLRTQYGLPGLGYEQSVRATNKWRMRSVLSPVVRSPRAWLSGDFLSCGEDPAADVVVKPLASSSARGVRRMTAGHARDWLRGHDGLWLVEEAVAVTREFHCDGAFQEGRLSWVEVSEYDRPVLRSHGTRSTCVLRRDDPVRPLLAERAGLVIEGLGCRDGVFHMEFLHDGSDLFFGEVGLRPGGTGIAELLQIATGADLWAAFVATQLGENSGGFAPRRAAEEITGLVMARTDQDGRPPVPPQVARELPGVVGLGDGNLEHGTRPSHMCEFEYLAFFEGLSTEQVPRLRASVAVAR